MELKDYQIKTLEQVKRFLDALAKEKQAKAKHASLDAWQSLNIGRPYIERKNGLGNDLPTFCLKIPTGGGKTLLATKVIDMVNTTYLKKRTGLVVWVVPTSQIYNQTIKSLRDRQHPYRQFLDIASGGKTLILERTEKFSPLDIQESLVVLMLMLPAASRQSKETLRMFRDNGGFTEFFPPEDEVKQQTALLQAIPNLDTFGNEKDFWGRQIKTSLGNVLRLLNPMIVLDEGHKAYSETAQKTLREFNPSLILELTATPTPDSNILVDILGIALNREDMIKLDLHLINKASTDWKDTLLAAKNERDLLEQKALEYEAQSGIYIRPICLIQAERTGKEQRGSRLIHSEDVREHLIKTLGIAPDQVAVKTSEKDELKEVDDIGGLMSRDCHIRYIVTKQALQEGWDCPFAYVLAILTNPSSKTALTQLVGRILRQPFARKTNVKELDESYVFCFQRRGQELLSAIKKGFGEEGLGDLFSRISTDEGFDPDEAITERTVRMREKFKKVAGDIILPVFVAKGIDGWRKVNYEMDIVSRIPWEDVKLQTVYNLTLSKEELKDTESLANLSEDVDELVRQTLVTRLKEGALKLDPVFFARHLLDIVPNPWTAFDFGTKVLEALLKMHPESLVINNFVFIIEELRKELASEKDRLAERIFKGLLKEGTLKFLVIGKDLGFSFPKTLQVSSVSKPLLKEDGNPLQRSLFDFVPQEGFNETEKTVAWYLEDQNRLFFWFRNEARRDYNLQGWRKQKIYPDFIFTKSPVGKQANFEKVFVVETKGLHLIGNEDTGYKKSVFEICNDHAKEKGIGELLKDKPIQFEVIAEDEWRRKFNEILV